VRRRGSLRQKILSRRKTFFFWFFPVRNPWIKFKVLYKKNEIESMEGSFKISGCCLGIHDILHDNSSGKYNTLSALILLGPGKTARRGPFFPVLVIFPI